jgi:CubicO group peptidase (beta-lactamase class C family)
VVWIQISPTWLATLLLAVACAPQPSTGRVPGAGKAIAGPDAPVVVAADATSAPAVKTTFAEPDSVGPRRFRVLGPFPNRLALDKKGRPGLDADYLTSIGGEAAARFELTTTVPSGDGAVTVREAELDSASTLDFAKLFGADADSKTAYAYAEWAVDVSRTALAIFGSDDGAAVWLNGRKVHRFGRDRALNRDSDRFELPLERGTNRLLVKVDNATGYWGFALRVFDGEAQKRFWARDLRRHIESFQPIPLVGGYLLDESFPRLVWSNPDAAERVFGKTDMRVEWYGPDLAPAERPATDGQYAAVVEATTLDGYVYRQIVTFAKVPLDAIPSFPSPPTREPPPLQVPWQVHLNGAQQAELSRHFWLGASDALSRNRDAAVAALALVRLGEQPPPKGEPPWLNSGFIAAAEQQLRLRLTIEGRAPTPLPPPERLATPSPELRVGSEALAGVRPGTTQKILAVARAWAKDDPSPFVVLIARRGVVFAYDGFNGFGRDATFYPASIGKTIAGLTFARAVDRGLLDLDQPVGSVLSDWRDARTARLTFRHCFNHVSGLTEHASHGGLFNAYLDNALLVEDAVFATPGTRFRYNGDDVNLAGKALEMVTGQSIWRLLYENMQRPFDEPVRQLDLGFGDAFTAMYLAKVGQMILQDGRYGPYRFFKPGFLKSLRPRRIAEFAPDLDDTKIEAGIGLAWMIDPPGPREKGVLGPNVIGHGASSGVTWRVDLDHDVIIVVGRSAAKDASANEEWATKLAAAVAEGLGP